MQLKPVLVDSLRMWASHEVKTTVPREMFQTITARLDLSRDDQDRVICEAYPSNVGDMQTRHTPVAVKILDFPS